MGSGHKQENERYRVSAVATDTEGDIRVLNYLRGRGLSLLRWGECGWGVRQCGSTEMLAMRRRQRRDTRILAALALEKDFEPPLALFSQDC